MIRCTGFTNGEETVAIAPFETLRSVGVSCLSDATDSTLTKVFLGCCDYFARRPYRQWFDQLEFIVQSTGASYYKGTAAHLDLVQWATDPTWAGIKDRSVRRRLLDRDGPFFFEQLRSSPIEMLLLNGQSVIEGFEGITGSRLEQVYERYGAAGDDFLPCVYDTDPTKPIGSWKEAWEKARADSKVRCRFHDLRHTGCTRMLEAGVPFQVVAELMGWSSATTIRMAKRYGHIGKESLRNAVNAIAAAAEKLTQKSVDPPEIQSDSFDNPFDLKANENVPLPIKWQ
jgi:hypothetical protein